MLMRGYKKDVLKKLKKEKQMKSNILKQEIFRLIINIKDTKNYSKVNNSDRLTVRLFLRPTLYEINKVLTKITNIGIETSFGEENKISFYGTISKYIKSC